MGVLTDAEKSAIRLRWKLNQMQGQLGGKRTPSDVVQRPQAQQKGQGTYPYDFNTILTQMKNGTWDQTGWLRKQRGMKALHDAWKSGDLSDSEYRWQMKAIWQAFEMKQRHKSEAGRGAQTVRGIH